MKKLLLYGAKLYGNNTLLASWWPQCINRPDLTNCCDISQRRASISTKIIFKQLCVFQWTAYSCNGKYMY
jgi:hypothetical protein